MNQPGAARRRGAGRPPQPASAARKHKDPESAAALPREISSAVQPRETTRARPKLNSSRLPAEQDTFNCVAAAEAMLVSALTLELSRATARPQMRTNIPKKIAAVKWCRLERMVRLEGTTECVTPQAATVIVMKETLRAADPVRGRGSCSRSRQRRQRESRTSETPSAPLEN